MKIDEILISEEEIQKKVKELGQEIENDYAGKENLVFIGILKGCFVFFADLIRNISMDFAIDFMSVSSYGNSTKSSGVVRIERDLQTEITGKDIIIVEDIVDTGLTLSYIKEILLSRKPASLEICTLLDKHECRVTPIEPDYAGFTIPDKFVVGYGLDYAEIYRNLPYIAVLKE